MDRVVRIVAGSVLVLVLAATNALAQATAQINGTVADPSGGVLPGALDRKNCARLRAMRPSRGSNVSSKLRPG